MGTLCVTGDFCDAVIAAVNVCTSVSGGNDTHDILFFNTCFFHCHLQALLRTHHGAAACGDDHGRFDLSVLIQDHNIRTCGTAVDPCHIINS